MSVRIIIRNRDGHIVDIEDGALEADLSSTVHAALDVWRLTGNLPVETNGNVRPDTRHRNPHDSDATVVFPSIRQTQSH